MGPRSRALPKCQAPPAEQRHSTYLKSVPDEPLDGWRLLGRGGRWAGAEDGPLTAVGVFSTIFWQFLQRGFEAVEPTLRLLQPVGAESLLQAP